MLPGKHPLSRLTTYFIEIYILVIFYFTQLYHGTRIMETLLGFYIGFALLLSFSYFELGNELIHADTRVSAIILIRLSITVNTLPAFITVFERARKEEIGGFGKNGLSFSAASVYFAKFITLSIPRILFFIPFTAIVYPLVKTKACSFTRH